MANLNSDEDNFLQQYINFDLFDDIQYNEQADCLLADRLMADRHPEPTTADTDIAVGNALVFDNLQLDLDGSHYLQDSDLSFNLRDSATGAQLSQHSRVPQSPVVTTLTTPPSAHRFRPIQPSSSRNPNTLNTAATTSLTNSLDQAFQKALEAVPGHHHLKVPTLEQHQGAYHVFRDHKPNSTQTPKERAVKKPRLKRSEGRACMRCKYHKRKCGSARPCIQCVEKFLGRRDLAFNACIRESPLEFNPFLTDVPVGIELDTEDSFYILKFLYVAKKKSEHVEVEFLRWIFSELLSVTTNKEGPGQTVLKLSSLPQLRSLQSSVTQSLLQILETSLRPENSRILTDRRSNVQISVALFLYTHLEILRAEQIPYERPQAMEVCLRYLFEYIALFLPGFLGLKLSDLRHCKMIEKYNISVQDLLDYATIHAVNHGPRTTLQILADAYSYSMKLLYAPDPESKATINEPNQDSNVENHTDTLLRSPKTHRYNPYSWPRDYPQLDDDTQVFGIWSLFWRNIPERMIKLLDFSEFDFCSLLLTHGNGNISGKPELSLPRKTWKQWDETAASFRHHLRIAIVIMSTSGRISTEDKRVLRFLYVMWVAPDEQDFGEMHQNPSIELKGAFRLFVGNFLQVGGLLEPNSFEDFLSKAKDSESDDLYARFQTGLPIFNTVPRFQS